MSVIRHPKSVVRICPVSPIFSHIPALIYQLSYTCNAKPDFQQPPWDRERKGSYCSRKRLQCLPKQNSASAWGTLSPCREPSISGGSGSLPGALFSQFELWPLSQGWAHAWRRCSGGDIRAMELRGELKGGRWALTANLKTQFESMCWKLFPRYKGETWWKCKDHCLSPYQNS